MRNWGQAFSLGATTGTQLTAMCVTMAYLLLNSELPPWEMHTGILGQNLEISLILCFLNTSGFYYVAV